MITGERAFGSTWYLKKLAQIPNPKMITGERAIGGTWH